MSWSIWKSGHVRDVKAALAKEPRSTFWIAAEQRAYDSARESIDATLDCMKDSDIVYVQACGSAYDDGAGYKGGNVQVLVGTSPVAVIGASGAIGWCEPAAVATG